MEAEFTGLRFLDDSEPKYKGNDGEMEVVEDEITEKHIGPYVRIFSSCEKFPLQGYLVLSEKVQRSKVGPAIIVVIIIWFFALVECEGESIDLSAMKPGNALRFERQEPYTKLALFLRGQSVLYVINLQILTLDISSLKLCHWHKKRARKL
ncbi:unnamed protein product [Ilex paraguariensis]|uniref:Uncharacterized protein n=1 Tax=Ilex paraguariensis TaxID=185542 RepID=A0ABC8RIZ1_9AQUA